MKSGHWMRPAGAVLLLAGAGAILPCACNRGPEGKESPAESAARAPGMKEVGVITIDKAVLGESGIQTAPLEPFSGAEKIKAYGTVVDIRDLVEARGGYEAAKAERKKARAGLGASAPEYARLQQLHESNKNISDKTVQTAQAQKISDEASARAAKATVETAEAALRLQWGELLAQWIAKGSQGLRRLVEQEDALVQVTLPFDSFPVEPAGRCSLEGAGGSLLEADFLSPAPRTDPRFQGRSFFYVAPGGGGALLPGMNLVAYLPAGGEKQGVIVPSSAVLWWEGKAWAYVQAGETRFVRREVPVDSPRGDGWFAAGGFAAGDRVVVIGAQMLLSQEFISMAGGVEEAE
jgi:hypothetical protein